MGAVQRLATVVIIGLVALSTILVLYAADEPNRIEQAEVLQKEAAITRATANYINLCLQCHGPAGEGVLEGTGRPGLPLGGDTYATNLNQHAIDADGEPYSGGMEARYDYLFDVIYNGRNAMPAWGASAGGQLNDEQVHEMVVFIQNVDWNLVYNEAIHAAGGYPTVEPTAVPTPGEPGEPTPTSEPLDPDAVNLTIETVDIAFSTNTLEGPADESFTITVTNNGSAQHDFVIDELDIRTPLLNAGESYTITISAPAGEYTYYCSVPGHRALMEGKLTLS